MMKILYAIQGTGNGHISRANILVPLLKEHASVDVLISGSHNELKVSYDIKYRCKGLGFYFGKKGGVDFNRTFKEAKLFDFLRDVKELPVEDYDIVLSDFEPVSAWACKLKNVICVGISHQSALLSANIPLPKTKDIIGSLILRYYAPADHYFCFHFLPYTKSIYYPILRKAILDADPQKEGFYIVYLPAFSDEKVIRVLQKVQNAQWVVFSKHAQEAFTLDNINIQPVDAEKFKDSLINCDGVLCGAGFETPAEALYLKKKLMVVPMKGQYEQHCNAAALRDLGVIILKRFKDDAIPAIQKWVENDNDISYNFQDQTQIVVEEVIKTVREIKGIQGHLKKIRLKHTIDGYK